MHFRIGDYVKNLAFHPVLNIEYYINALELLSNNIENIDCDYDILYFGEERDTMKIIENINKIKERLPKFNFIQCDFNIEDWEQMLLMSLCEHNIIANSSFSWWAAYFNDFSEKIVCYPSIWHGSIDNVDDLIPKSWVKITI